MIESNDTLALKDLLSAASPLIKTLVETFVAPKLDELKNKFKRVKAKTFIPTEENFVEYYHRIYKKLIVVNTLVFKNSQRFLDDIYIPLTITSAHNIRNSKQILGFPEELSNEFQNILITDTAGMGKSTLMKKIFIDCMFQNNGIPIFVELRRLNRNKTIIQEIQEQLSSLEKDFDSKLLSELLSAGDFIIILDGYDEIPLSDREIVTVNLQEFITKASLNKFFITSRPENALAGFGNFHEFKIDPLEKNEAFELLRKYDNQGTISKLLIKKLEESDMANIEEFLINPLLVSLLFTAFEHKQAIPFKKYLFYRQVYDANFEAHDLTKGDSYIHDKYSKLEIDDFHRVLRHIGFNCFKLQRIEFTKDALLKLISEARKFCAGLSFNDSDFLQDIIKTVPLFAQDGNYYKWSHKSLQEYFTAQFIYLDSKEKQNEILLKIYNHPSIDKFINVLDLYYDMDYKTFRNTVEFEFLKKYVQYNKKYYISEYKNVSPEHVEERKELMFLCDSFIFMANRQSNARNFDSEKFSAMLRDCEKTFQIQERNFSGLLNSFGKNQDIYCFHSLHKSSSLLSLFASKRNSIIRSTKRVRSGQFSNIFTKEYEVKKVVDDAMDELNTPEDFNNLNEFIKFTRTENIAINHDEAIKKLSLIENEMKTEQENNFLLDDF